MTETPGLFEIPRVKGNISFDDFYRDHFQPERPVIVEGAGRAWPAVEKWDLMSTAYA